MAGRPDKLTAMPDTEHSDDKLRKSRAARRAVFGRWAYRLTDREMELIRVVARVNRKSIVDYVRDLVVTEAEATLKRIRGS